ncbi:hypothetical protein Tco_1092508 [Tanacetum coccineum]|uniref:RRM domain-containing protein n=1 Tax=Tanacetum coccineum TaxID=301880 RepID=A0ABQ5IBD6_9ASTR
MGPVITLRGSTYGLGDLAFPGRSVCTCRNCRNSMKCVMCYGDKMETAKNARFACSLHRQGMGQIYIMPNVDISTDAIKEPFKKAISGEQNLCKEGENRGARKIVYDRVTGMSSKGFAFIATTSVQEAKEASRMFNGAV